VLQLKNKEQEQLLALVSALEIPIVTLADGVIFAPIVGSLDSRRAKELTTRLLQATSRQRARLVIIDIAGMTIIDTMVAKSLVDASRAVRLLGCDVTITGISATVASTLIQLGVRLEGVEVARSPQEALAQYRERAAEWELPKRAINGALVAQASQPAMRR
jgi:rsbT co-antagonist protein RsbR